MTRSKPRPARSRGPGPRARQPVALGVIAALVGALAACSAVPAATPSSSTAALDPSSPTARTAAERTARPSAAASVPASSSPAPTASPTPTVTATATASPSVGSAAGLSALTAPPGIELTATDHTYPITGSTGAELLASLDEHELTDPWGLEVDALTTWQYEWWFEYDVEGGLCRLTRTGVILDLEVTMPRWDPPPDADSRLVVDWSHYAARLREHERGHEAGALDHAVEMLAALHRVAPDSSCARLESTANAAADAVFEAGERWQRAYDVETLHGERQGAVFP